MRRNNQNDLEVGIELASLLAGVVVVDPIWDRKITGVTLNSKMVKPGDLFIACVGEKYDASQFIAEALERGAVAVITEGKQGDELNAQENSPIFYVPELQQKVGVIAARFYQHPSRRMRVIGITGTNGKTSCSHFLAQALHTKDEPCATIGTVGHGIICGQLEDSRLTTPDAVALQALLAKFEKKQVKTVTMEVTSHALMKNRVKHVEMQTAIFTNLSRDHLDYHGTMQAYAKAKQKLFEKFGLRQAIINADDPFSQTLLKVIPPDVNILTFSTKQKDADVSAHDIVLSENGIKAKVKTPWGEGELESQLLGCFNVSNLLAVLATLGSMGFSLADALSRIKKIQGVIGRMQTYKVDRLPVVVVDFAHTPDALKNALLALRQHVKGKIWCIFGCGGERDKGKRPLMGKVVEKYADKLIITDDNPRNESPQHIVRDILVGISKQKNVLVEHDRSEALALALKKAKRDDWILLAGKGHEAYQVIKEKKIPQSDQLIVETLLQQHKLCV